MRAVVSGVLLSVFLMLLTCIPFSHVSRSIDPISHLILADKNWIFIEKGLFGFAGGGGDGAGGGGGEGGDDSGGERQPEEAGELSDMLFMHLLRRRKQQKLLFGNSLLLCNQLQHPKQTLWVLLLHPQNLQLLWMPYLDIYIYIFVFFLGSCCCICLFDICFGGQTAISR